MPKAKVAEKVTSEEEAEMVADNQPDNEELEALRAKVAELESQQTPQRVIDYEWPKLTEEQAKRHIVGGDAVTRVVKVTYKNADKRFWSNGGTKTVHIAQYRYPLAGKKWDLPRLTQELQAQDLVLIEEAFPEAKHYCEVNNCWNEATYDGAFCAPQHRDAALTAHDRYIAFE